MRCRRKLSNLKSILEINNLIKNQNKSQNFENLSAPNFLFLRLKFKPMKKFMLLFVLLIGQTIFSQIIFNFSKDRYYNAKVYLEDGSLKEGYLKDFNDENLVSFYPRKVAEAFASMEEKGGLSNDFYYFRSDENSEEEKISLQEISHIELSKQNPDSEDYQFTLDKVKLATIDKDLNMALNTNYVLLPVYYSSGKLKIYTITTNMGTGSFPSFYMKSLDNERAVRIFKIGMGDVFNLKKIGPKIYESLFYFGKDCDAFIEKLTDEKDFYYNAFVDYAKQKLNYKIFQEKWGLMEKDLKKAKKSMSKDDFKIYQAKKHKEYLDGKTQYFYDIIMNDRVVDYINSCE